MIFAYQRFSCQDTHRRLYYLFRVQRNLLTCAGHLSTGLGDSKPHPATFGDEESICSLDVTRLPNYCSEP